MFTICGHCARHCPAYLPSGRLLFPRREKNAACSQTESITCPAPRWAALPWHPGFLMTKDCALHQVAMPLSRRGSSQMLSLCTQGQGCPAPCGWLCASHLIPMEGPAKPKGKAVHSWSSFHVFHTVLGTAQDSDSLACPHGAVPPWGSQPSGGLLHPENEEVLRQCQETLH